MGGLASGRTAGNVTGGDRPIFGLYNPRPSGRVGLPSDRGLPETQGTPVVDPNPLGGNLQGFGVGPSGFGRKNIVDKSQLGLSPAAAARFRAQIKRNQVLEARGLPPRQIGTPIPYARSVPQPGGGYSGGVIPRFQTGGAPRRTGALHGSIIGDPSSGRWVEHFPAIGQNPIYSGWGAVDTTQRGLTKRSFNNQNLPYPNRPPGGGYSGGVIPRFQAGGVPVGGGYGEYVKGFLGKTSGPGMREWARDRANKASHIQQAQRNLAPPRGRGGYSGGVIPRFQTAGAVAPTNLGPLPGSPAAQPGYVSPYPYLPYSTPESTYGIIPRRPSQRQMQMQAAHRGRGPGGWQVGGQLEDPLYPVESELADESPWYPDEDVGYEAAAPMQGGFDIFGRAGG